MNVGLDCVSSDLFVSAQNLIVFHQLEDWQVFLCTGINHLMSISGLYITMLEGLAFGFAAVAPSISIFTNEYLNRFGHLKPEVFERYQTTKGLLYRSDYNGAIEIDFVNHHHIQILGWRNRDKRYWHDSFESTN